MIASEGYKVTKIKNSKLDAFDMAEIPFGKYFTDHMLEVDYADGAWQTPEIKPYQPMMMDPSIAAIHYGQSIFEGVKAYKNKDGAAAIFRPEDNFKRFNISADRMQMPAIPEEIFIQGMRQLVKLDEKWIPQKDNHSLYIRPFMFCTDEAIGVKAGDKFKFMIILSPAGPYYASPIRIYVEEHFVRAVPGGIGFAKAAGNYAAAMYATSKAREKGYDQVLWTDAFEHKFVQECGTMNVFFIIGNKAITPGLETGTILNGITRDSVITLLKEKGIEVEERRLNIDEVIAAHKAGELKEVFGTGTAATISPIKELCYQDYKMTLDVDSWTVSPEIKKQLNDIRYGRVEDTHGWMISL